MVDSASALARVAQLVVKNGVGLGVLSEEQRPAALALAWAALPTQSMSEPQINEALKKALAGPVRCLRTDHVELRRWLVDARWLVRDGFGREYQRVACEHLLPFNQPWAALWLQRDVSAWVAEQRELQDTRRAQRRSAWQGSNLQA